MKVFVSYSIIDRELHLITLLVSKLRESGYTVFLSDHISYTQDRLIPESEFFIGIITNHSDSINAVFTEYNYAKSLGINAILLIENGVKVHDPQLEFISFERSRPNYAIDKLFGISNQLGNQPKVKNDDWSEVLTAGVIIAGLAALISLLAGGSKK
jgi:hypothetical protein